VRAFRRRKESKIMRITRGVVFFSLSAAVASAVACSTGSHPSPTSSVGPTGEDGTGTVGMQFTLPGGEQISVVSYTLTNGVNSYSGTVDVSGSSTISFVVGNVASGSGYSLKLSAFSVDHTAVCTGTSAPFSVSNRTTTAVNVDLACTPTVSDAGPVLVTGPQVNCAVWNTIVANPSQGTLGNSVTLNAAAQAPDPGGITFTWTVIAGTGTISNNASAVQAGDAGATDTATFTCPTSGETDTIQLVVGDGPIPDGGSCPATDTTGTIQVVCGSPPACQNPLVGTGVEAAPDTATGSCPPPSVNTGTLKDANGNFCCSPNIVAVCPGGTEATPNTATGTCPVGQANTGRDAAGNFCCEPLAPCTAAGQAGCVQCQGSTGGACSPTEQRFVKHDIAKGLATAPGPDNAAGGCYAGLIKFGCIDDTAGDVGNECEDVAGSATAGAGAGQTWDTLCLNVIDCFIATSCITSAPASPSAPMNVACFCGANGGQVCTTVGPAGVCEGPLLAGFGLPACPPPMLCPGEASQALGQFGNQATGGGQATNIFACAIANNLLSCLE
jgi:hypothetical protein